MAEEPAHLLTAIGRRVPAYQFVFHSNNLTQIAGVGAHDYAAAMSAFDPFLSLVA